MADERKTSIKGNIVAIGDHSTIVQQNFIPKDLPPGSEVEIKIKIPQRQKEEQEQREQQQQEQQQRARDQSKATQNLPEQRSQTHHKTMVNSPQVLQETQQNAPNKQTEPKYVQSTRQQCASGMGGARPKHQGPSGPSVKEQPSCLQTRRQPIITQETQQPIQPRQNGKAHCQGRVGAITPTRQVHPITSQASYDGDEQSSRWSTFGPQAMTLTSFNETDLKQQLSTSQTDPKADSAVHSLVARSLSLPGLALGQNDSTPSSLPYSMDPSDCPPQQPSSSQQSPARALPKPKSGPFQSVTLMKTFSGVNISDIAVVRTTIVVSDMERNRIYYFEIGAGNTNFLELSDCPKSVTPFKRDRVLVGLLNAKKCYILDLKTRKLQPITFAREYAAVSIIHNCKIVGCSSGVLDILNLNGTVLNSFPVNGLTYPGHVSVGTKICVTDCKTYTITILTVPDDEYVTEDTKQITGKPALRGVVQNRSNVFMADENGNQILSCDASGSAQVNVFLNQSDTLSKPRGLCINGDTLFIAEKDGAIKSCKISNVPSIRL